MLLKKLKWDQVHIFTMFVIGKLFVDFAAVN